MDDSEKFWNGIAARYAKKPIANLEAYHAKLDATNACLKPDDVILDVGCGTGSLALELSTYVSEVHAIDLSREMIKIANQKAADEEIGNEFLEANELEGADEGDLDVSAEKPSLSLQKADRSLHEFHRWYQRGRLIVDPEWQRHYIWDRTRASRLIESFLMELLEAFDPNRRSTIEGVR